MTIECDVLVVGSGIAGSTCASVLKRLGTQDVVILERSNEIGMSHSQKIDFAEDKGLKKLLVKYNLPIYKETNISRWYAPNNEMFELKSKINDVWFKRGDKNSYENRVLKNQEVNNNTDVVKIKPNYVEAVNKISKQKLTYKPKNIVVATGHSKPYLNKYKKESIIKNLNAFGFVVDNLNIDPDIPYVFFDNKISKNSYIFMIQDSTEEIGYIAYGSISDKPINFKDLRKNKEICSLISDSKLIKKINGSIYVGKKCPLAYDNTLFVGDAANLMDPFLSYGITNAVKSGVFAAESITNDKDVSENYKKMLNIELSKELNQQLKLRKILDKLEDKDINNIIKLFNEINKEGNIEELANKPLKLAFTTMPYLLKNPGLLKIIYKGMSCVI